MPSTEQNEISSAYIIEGKHKGREMMCRNVIN